MEIEVARPSTDVWHLKAKIQNPLSPDGEKSKLQNPTLTVGVGVLILAVYLAWLPFIERSWRTTGDEPHYLLAAHSLVKDFDFDLANNYEQLDYLNFYYSKDITPQLRLSPSGQQILDHQLGLPVVIAPAYALAGRWGVLAFQAVLGALLAGLTFKLTLFISQDALASLLATLLVALSPPLLMYQYLVYPELLGAFLTTLVLYYAVSQHRPTPTSATLLLLSLIALPWLNRRFIPLTLLLALLIAWSWRESVGNIEKPKPISPLRLLASSPFSLLLLIVAMCSTGLLIWFNSQLTQVATPDITVPATFAILWERVTRGLVGWLVDQQRGLFVYAPIYILALWGLPFLLGASWRQRNYHWFVILPLLLSLSITAVAGGFWIAWELGPRFLVVALPALAPLLALAWRAYSGHIIGAALILLLGGVSLSNSLVILYNPELPYKSSLPLYYGERLGLPLTEYLPGLAEHIKISPAPADDPAAAQVVAENGEMLWAAPPGSSFSLVKSGPLTALPFGHYQLKWSLRADPGLPPETNLVHISLKAGGGGHIFNKIITAADLPTDGSYGQVHYTFHNPNVDRWRTPPIFTAVTTGHSHIWAKEILFTPNPFYAVLLPYLLLLLLTVAVLWSWYRTPAQYQKPIEANNSASSPLSWGISAPKSVVWGFAGVVAITSFGYVFYQHQSTSHSYEASELNHFVGRAVVDRQAGNGQGWLVDPQVDPPQKAIYGPFDIYEPGLYQVTFRLKLPELVDTNQDLARLQVMATANFDELIIQPLRLEHFSKPNLYHDFVLTINNPRRQALSFEVYYLGVAPLLIDQVTVARVEE